MATTNWFIALTS